MKRHNIILLVSVFVVIFVVGGTVFWLVSNADRLLNPNPNSAAIGLPDNSFRAQVVEIVEDGMVTDGDFTRPYQVVTVQVLEGPYQEIPFQMEYGRYQLHSNSVRFRPGDRIFVSINQRIDDGVLMIHFLDFDRTRQIAILFGAFVFFSLLIGGWKGLRGLIGIIFSLLVIIFFIIPQILSGRDPVFVSILGSFIFLSVSMYLVYGWTLKTHAAILGILLALLITGLLAAFFVSFTRLTGMGDENAMFLVQQAPAGFDLRGLLLAGMLIGSLGVSDDLVISQSSAVFELHAADRGADLKFLYRRAMNIGRDHIASTVNTLVLAYAGASLPMLLLFTINSGNYGSLLNMNLVAEEVVRTLVGSIGLFASVPITTLLACYFAVHNQRFGRLRPFLGPENQWSAPHSHSH